MLGDRRRRAKGRREGLKRGTQEFWGVTENFMF